MNSTTLTLQGDIDVCVQYEANCKVNVRKEDMKWDDPNLPDRITNTKSLRTDNSNYSDKCILYDEYF